jgi:hypothetical protein
MRHINRGFCKRREPKVQSHRIHSEVGRNKIEERHSANNLPLSCALLGGVELNYAEEYLNNQLLE